MKSINQTQNITDQIPLRYWMSKEVMEKRNRDLVWGVESRAGDLPGEGLEQWGVKKQKPDIKEESFKNQKRLSSEPSAFSSSSLALSLSLSLSLSVSPHIGLFLCATCWRETVAPRWSNAVSLPKGQSFSCSSAENSGGCLNFVALWIVFASDPLMVDSGF